ncbi:hypothetical protein Tco_0412575 [Tanacetum coccineum]
MPRNAYFNHIQPNTEFNYDSEDMEFDDEAGYTTDEESVLSEHEAIDLAHTVNTQSFKEELSSEEDLDEWLNAEMEKHMNKQKEKNKEDALIAIIKSIREKYTVNYDNFTSNLPSLEELNPGSFLLPFTINNYNSYAMANIDASNNVMPRSIYEYLKLANLGEATMCFMMTKVVKIVECGLLATLTQVSVMVIKRFSEKANMECLDNRIDDTTREQRYYEWVAQNYEFDAPSTTVSDKYPYKTNYPTPIPLDEWESRCHITYTGSTYNQNIPNNDPTSFSLEHSELGEKILDSFDVEYEYAKEIGNPYSRRFDEYKRVFDNEVENLSNEYTLRMGKKGYVLDDVWEKCEQYHKKVIDSWHDIGYREKELW